MKIYLPGHGHTGYEDALTALGAEIAYEDAGDCSGLLLPGGCDIDPSLYGEENRGSVEIDGARDKREMEALRAFISSARPVFGICRGMQMINIAFGGSLLQDIPGHDPIGQTDRQHDSRTTDEILKELYGERFVINSCHHQAIDRIGRGLRAVQWAPDGTIEAIRHESLPIFGVQWHPERITEPIDGRRLLARWLSMQK